MDNYSIHNVWKRAFTFRIPVATQNNKIVTSSRALFEFFRGIIPDDDCTRTFSRVVVSAISLFEIEIKPEYGFESENVRKEEILADTSDFTHGYYRECAKILWEYTRHKFVSTMWDMETNSYVLGIVRQSVNLLSSKMKWNPDQCLQACEVIWATFDHNSYARRAINLDPTFMEGVLSGMSDKTVFLDAIICNYWFWKVGNKYLNAGAHEYDKISELHNNAQNFFIRTRHFEVEKTELRVIRIRKIIALLKDWFNSETKFIGSLIELQVLVGRLK